MVLHDEDLLLISLPWHVAPLPPQRQGGLGIREDECQNLWVGPISQDNC